LGDQLKTLIIDNYDSFSYNIVHFVAESNQEAPVVVRNDEVAWEELSQQKFDNIVISPGPGRPERAADFGVSREAILYSEVPVLGVCLGHQGMAAMAGGRVVRSSLPMHGRTSEIIHDGTDLFTGIPSPFTAARYHSLIVSTPLPESLLATAWTSGGIVMALKHQTRPQWGVQFHPESIITEHGRLLLRNFRDLTLKQCSRTSVSIGTHPTREAPSDAKSLRLRRATRRRAYWRELPYAVDTEKAFEALFKNSATSFWLDSSLVEPGRSRWSYLGDASGPNAALIEYDCHARTLRTNDHGTETESKSIFEYLNDSLAQDLASDLPCPFTGGHIGWFGYEMRHECVAAIGTRANTPDALFIRVDRFIAVDHLDNRTYVVAVDTYDEASRSEKWISDTTARLGNLPALSDRPEALVSAPMFFRLLHGRADYIAQIEQCLEWIKAGESYQICLTNEISCRAGKEPLTLYRTLRKTNPAPFAAYLKWPGGALLSASPERFLAVDRRGFVETKPIKGTIARGRDSQQDQQLVQSLRSSEKDRAENVMIVDLLRNDLSRVCQVGTVVVPKLCDVESYSTVHQLVSTVHGVLRTECNVVDLVKATFPGGSMTGAPKVRTLDFIDLLERRPRGIYAGAMGWIGNDGAADLSIVIRAIVVNGDFLTLGVGGGIVAQSTPSLEFDEMLLKAQASIRAIVTACTGGFDDNRYHLKGI
jgi:para-aminobenzoate synthetase